MVHEHEGHSGCQCGGGGSGCMSEKKVREMAVMMASHQVADNANFDEVLKVANRISDFILEGKV